MRCVAYVLVLSLIAPVAAQSPPGGGGVDSPAGRGPRPVAAAPPGGAAGARLPAPLLLDARVTALSFDEAALSDVFDFLAELAGVNVVVRWERLAELGVRRDAPITLRVRNMRLGQVLWFVLNEAAPDRVRLAYRLDADTLLITTAEDLGREMITRVYDARDLILPEIANPSISFGRQRTYVASTTPMVAAGAVGVMPQTAVIGSGSRLVGENPFGTIYIDPNQPGDEVNVGSEADERMRRLIDVITATIEPATWRVNGGAGTIEAHRGLLVIRNSPLVHQQIGGAIRE